MKKTIVFLLIGMVLATSGCASLRKKFIRKKKSQKEEPVYINFKEYPKKPSREAYIDYYLFVKGWLEDLSESLRVDRINNTYNYKRAKRAIDGAVMNLEQIIAFLNDEGKEKIYPLYRDLTNVKDTMDKNHNLSVLERQRIMGRVERFNRKFQSEFKYSQAQKWM